MRGFELGGVRTTSLRDGPVVGDEEEGEALCVLSGEGRVT